MLGALLRRVKAMERRAMITACWKAGNSEALACDNPSAASDCFRQSLRHLTRISSTFGPQLADHCERVFEEWVNQDPGE